MKTLVLGASENPERYSNKAVNSLLSKKHEVVAIGSKSGKIQEVMIVTEQENFEDIDTVTLYLNPKRQIEYYDYIVNLKPRRVVFNPGTENPEFYEILHRNNIETEVACTLVLLSTGQY
ncbi:MAG: CoA-binding protein [Flavobacteriaceae bacterium]|jgi:predicted CoA-binding protein|nr:CoA-binding protein [Flavobacteriaceae bacterium]